MPAPEQTLAALHARATIRTTEHSETHITWQHWGGEGAPLLLVHGGFGSWSHWAANVEALSQSRSVWTVDLPGLGSSGEMPRPWTTQHFAQLVFAGWCELIGDEPFELSGFSFGAMVGGQLAALAEEQCLRCSLIGASGFGPLHRQVALLAPPGPEVPVEKATAVHRENLARLMLHTPGAIDDFAVCIHSDNLARHRFRSRSMARSSDLADILPEIQAQLVGIWGACDATAGGRSNIEARRELFLAAQSGAEFYVVDGIGHWAMYESPERINRLILGE
ncbi:alpha/beta hydrolase [Halioglobus maricola]|uniref:Alpha/beta hydrolase n=1 Tax=Halioglobus maricola TaxID=2601894 RepID=A0A5P9NI23_9GAMM|nr:alpha/beta hydrolase [Halioglobus maricola]QFU75176.1 alpha/beta hydrolase [Halioglobus maricola]